MVFLAEQVQVGRQVAVKFLHPHVAKDHKYVQRFRREIEIATLFDHPSIVRVYDVGESPSGLPFIVMELLKGQDLSVVMKETPGSYSAERVMELGEQILDGLAEAHSHGVVHRDIKPANLFLVEGSRGESLRILDFGVARLMDPDLTRLTAAGTYTGTPAYMPPEAFLFPDSSGRKTADVYAVGLVLLELLIGRSMMRKASLDQLVIFHLSSPLPMPRRVYESPLGEVIRRATLKHPGDRYQSGEEMLGALREARRKMENFRLEAEEIPPVPKLVATEFFMKLGEVEGEEEKLGLLRRQEQHRVFPEVEAPAAPPPAEVGEARRQGGMYLLAGGVVVVGFVVFVVVVVGVLWWWL